MHPATILFARFIPPWLKDDGVSSAVGSSLDPIIEAVVSGVKMRFARYAPGDALPDIGWELQLERGPGESDEAYAKRLEKAWTTWRWAGTDYGMLKALATAGFSFEYTYDGVTPMPEGWPVLPRNDSTDYGQSFVAYANVDVGIVHNSDWETLPTVAESGTPSIGGADRWARFWVVIDGLVANIKTGKIGTANRKIGAGRRVVGIDTWKGAAVTTDTVEQWRWLIRKWKATGTTCVEILVAQYDWLFVAGTIGIETSPLTRAHAWFSAANQFHDANYLLRIPVGEAP